MCITLLLVALLDQSKNRLRLNRMRAIFRLDSRLILALVIALLLLLTNGLPLFRLAVRALGGEALSWLLQSPQVRNALGHSLFVSFSVGLIATFLALVLVLVLEKTNFVGRGFIRVLLFVPLVVPPQILTIAWLAWAGPVGYFHKFLKGLLASESALWNLYSAGGIILLLVVFALPVAYLTIAAGIGRIPKSVEEAAQIDGASVLLSWRYILTPLLLANILAAFVLSFLAALGNFGIQALLGIPARYLTLPTLIYQKIVSFAPGNFDKAAALGLLLAIPALAALGFQYSVLSKRETRLESLLEKPLRYSLGWAKWPISLSIWLLVAGVVTLGPFISMLLTALTRAYGLAPRWENLSLSHFSFVLFELNSFIPALRNSLFLSTAAALIAAFMALVLGYLLMKLSKRFALPVQLIVDLPYALPGIVFALALILVWLRSPVPGLKLYGTVYLLLIAYVGRYLAFALQPLGAAWRQLDPSVEEAAKLDGAGFLRRLWFVLIPLVAPSLLVAALLVFLNAFSELSISALLAGSRSETLGWLVFGLEQAGSTAQAAALSTLLVLVIALLALLLALFRRFSRGLK